MKTFLLAALAICAGSLSAVQTEVVDGVEWSFTVSNGQATIERSAYPNPVPAIPVTTSGDLTIPSMLGGYPVTSIGSYAFYECRSLTSVEIPEGVTTIGDDAFSGCSSLTSVVIPEGVTTIGWSAFSGCSSLTSVVISGSVTSIGSYAFYGCSLLTSVVFPEGVTTIGESAFSGCSLLTSVEISGSETTIGGYAFEGCSSLSSVEITAGVTTIGGYAFEGCSSLSSVEITAGVTTIGDSAFWECSSLTSVVIPGGVTTIGKGAFSDCSSLTSVVIPEGETTIGDYAFYECRSLTSVEISEGVTTIGDYAFYECSSLTSVVIPGSVTTIGEWAFSDCSSLTSVVIPGSVTTIGEGAFSGCSSLTSVVIPGSVASMGWAFDGCDSLDSIQFQGPPPKWFWDDFPWNYSDIFSFPLEYGAAWEKVLEEADEGDLRSTVTDVLVVNRAKVDVRAEMTTPKTMKVSYTVTSDLPSVKVRAVAFKDGVRSFANIVPVRTGEGVPQGESVETNVEHTFVWEVANDWDTDLDKVAVEILVQEGPLLPQELITIPATETHKAMTITRNSLTEPWLFDALVWCFAEGDEQLQIKDGRVSVGGVDVANGNKLIGTDTTAATALLNYLYGKMGYKVLAGEELAYAESATRLDFASEGLRQVSVKIDEGE